MSSRSSLRWTALVSLFAAAGAALVLIFLLAIATNNTALYERHYGWLQALNYGVTAVLGLVILGALARLASRMRHGKFGTRLLIKLAAIFAFVGVLPGALIYGVSYQFVTRSIESWFDVQVEGALEAGLNLGRTTLQTLVTDLSTRTRLAAERGADSPERLQVLALERLREQLGAQSVAVLSSSGQVQVVAGGATGPGFVPERPTSALLKQARAGRSAAQLEGLDEDNLHFSPTRAGTTSAQADAEAAERGARIRAVAWIPSGSFVLGNDDRFLQITMAVPTELATNALSVQKAYSEYQQRALGRQGLRKMYIGTLTLTLILAVFSALVMAAVLGNQLGRPLVVLAEGVRRVASGDLRPTEVFASRDELGGLTRSFADMTQQLADARSLAQRSLAEVESAQTHLQTILDNLTAGVIVFDAAGHIGTVNPGATRILRAPLAAFNGKPLDDVPGLAEFAQWVDGRFSSHSREIDPTEDDPRELEQWQDSVEQVAGHDHAPLTLLVRGAPLPGGARLLVFDDISDIVSAQRNVAWAEVARRLAHEIKNPLTPIQLSAERMQHKLESKLTGTDQQLLVRSVGTIVNQVQAMKQLVNEFRDFARLPAAKLEPLDLNGLVGDVLTLYAHEQEAGRLWSQLDPELPRIEGDGSQLRQVVHNLVQNALDAVEDRPDGDVLVRTDLVRDPDDGSIRAVRLRVIDNGPGFSDKLLKRAFEPYVTTKARGTGLGLAVVKKIVEEHGAKIRVRNLQEQASNFVPLNEAGAVLQTGAQVSISFSRWTGATPLASADTRAPMTRL